MWRTILARFCSYMLLLLFWFADCNPSPDPNPCIGSRNIFLVHESDCQKYYFCFSDKAIVRSCPSNLHWNQLVNNCDLPCNAKCIHDVKPRELNVTDMFEPTMLLERETHENVQPSREEPLPNDEWVYISVHSDHRNSMWFRIKYKYYSDNNSVRTRRNMKCRILTKNAMSIWLAVAKIASETKFESNDRENFI